MIRLFETNKIRPQVILNGIWDFHLENSSIKEKIPVPSCWEMFPNYETYRGLAFYSKIVNITKKTNIRLVFKGVSHTARVFWNGEFVKHHYNAYTPFSHIIKDVEPGSYELKIEVDNSFNEHSALHVPNDYYTYGGITRAVALEYLNDYFIERLEFVSKFINGKWQATFRAIVKNLTDAEFASVNINFNIANQIINGKIISRSNDELIFESVHDFDNVLSWCNEAPNLYFLEAQLTQDGVLIDDLIERVGFREIKVENDKILLNNKQLFLTGFNRHEDHPLEGCALSFMSMAKDIAILKDLGSNTVRTSHYPNDELFLDLCDEHGLYVWEENHARGLSELRMENPNFDKQCADCIDEMVKNHFNHPSIIIWAVLNECASNTVYGKNCYANQINQIKSLDSSRPVTFATCHQNDELSLVLADIISWNLYYGWYESVDTATAFEKLLEFSDKIGGAGKPFIMSEFGGGAIPGYRDRRRVKWSEEKQVDILTDNLSVYLNHSRISGALIWQFCDCLVTEEEWFHARPRTKNNKGIVDEFRRPKLAYDVVKQMFEAKIKNDTVSINEKEDF